MPSSARNQGLKHHFSKALSKPGVKVGKNHFPNSTFPEDESQRIPKHSVLSSGKDCIL